MIPLNYQSLLRAIALLISAVLVAMEFAISRGETDDTNEMSHPWGAFFASAALAGFITSAIMIVAAISEYSPPCLSSYISGLLSHCSIRSQLPTYDATILASLFLGFVFLFSLSLGIFRDTFLNLTDADNLQEFLPNWGKNGELREKLLGVRNTLSGSQQRAPNYVILGNLPEEVRENITGEGGLQRDSTQLKELLQAFDGEFTSFYLIDEDRDFVYIGTLQDSEVDGSFDLEGGDSVEIEPLKSSDRLTEKEYHDIVD